MRRAPKEAQGIAAELARTKAALASAQETIAWQRAEIDRLIDQLKDTTPPPGAPDA